MASETHDSLDTTSLFLTAYTSYSTTDDPPPAVLSPIPPDIPHSKLVPGTRFLVDGFRFAGGHSMSYFLSHFHSDHYAGLSSSWCKGVVFCSEITARLLVETLKVPCFFVMGLPLGQSVSIDGCEVTLVDANHCLGAVQFLFKVPRADEEGFRRYVHTGDFRFHESMKLDSALVGFVGADAVFLDTTYCNPKFTFPSQDESIDYVVSTIEKTMVPSKGSSERVLFLIATYVVGKERILVEVSRRCSCMIYVDSKKMSILRVLGYGDSRIFTEDASATDVHVIGWNLLGETWPYFRPNFAKMREMTKERGYTRAVGFVPTGWMYETKRYGFSVRVKDSLEIHLVPYSEHSSYSELREYIRFLRPKSVIPTVGFNIERIDGKHVRTMQRHFACLVDETANKQEFLADFWKKARNSDDKQGHTVNIDSNHGGEVKADEDMDNSDDPSTPYSERYTKQEASLRSVNTSDESIEVAVEELSYSLPSWVGRDQMVGLLTCSGGDIVEAVSTFYEHETDLFEQASCSPASVSQKSLSSYDAECSKSTNIGRDIDCSIKPTSFPLNLANRNIHISKTPPKKRGSTVGNKTKKKGKKGAALKFCGSKQSTITKFFQKLVHESPCGNRDSSSKGQSQGSKSDDVMQLSVNCTETYGDELDQFLEIINFQTSRQSAASLLEKSNGNLNAALELYYSISCSNPVNKYLSSSVFSTDAHSRHGAEYNNTNDKEKPFKGKIDMKTSSGQDISVVDISATLVSLPVENYSPIEHACWKSGQPAPYLHLARTFDLVEQEKGKIKTSAILCNMFRSILVLSPEDVLAAVYLCTNKIAPDHQNVELHGRS